MDIQNLFKKTDIFNQLSKISINGKTLVSPLYGAAKSLFVSKIEKNTKQIVVLFPDVKSAQEFYVELDAYGLTTKALLINELTPEALQEKLTIISGSDEFIIVATYSLLFCKLPLKKVVESTTITISTGGQLGYDEVIEYLNLYHYQQDKFVEGPGEYSRRGAIIDFWSYSEKNPVRLEFDGDFLDSIRFFNYESQRSIEKVESVTLAAPLNPEIAEEKIVSFTDIFSYLSNPVIIASNYELEKLVPEEINPFIEKKEIKEAEKEEEQEYDFEDDFPDEVVIPEPESFLIETAVKTFEFYKEAHWIVEGELKTEERIEIGFTEAPSINSNYQTLFNRLKEFVEQEYRVIIAAENPLQTNKLKDLLSEINRELEDFIDEGKVQFAVLTVKEGFVHKEEKLVLLTDYQIFNKPFRSRIISVKKNKKAKPKSFTSIKNGDFVVHEDYGIGKYAGLQTIKIGEVDQESMKIIYSEGGVVYVNLNYLSLVKKFSSNESLTPQLSTLGTGQWDNVKKKTKKKIKEAAKELIELYAKRKAAAGHSFSPDTIWQKELEASFFYEDTPDQEKVTAEVKEDMEAANPMDRLVCGDVGFGKTEIAVRAAFKAVQDGKQAAVLVPTTILAEQHYNTFVDRLSQFPVKMAPLSRFQKKKDQTETLKELEKGNVDIIIGTHRLLSKDVKFKDLGLLIIDEEHRFGVGAKEKLRTIKVNVDTLTLTATPIPRTLNLSLLGARDLSLIATPPPNRQSIFTQVSVFDIYKIRQWIEFELGRSGQVYFVHDRVHSIEKIAGYLHKYIPGIKVAVAHGQMKPADLEDVIHGFMNKKYDVLLSTKIIESGIDIPNVNTIIINRADRFGLAELHQLRGRVGRSNRQAYAYFLVPSMQGISKKALRRLQAIEEYTDVGGGFNLSMRDLEIRGAGNLLGNEQSGFINEVGFDLYVKLINEAVEELKTEEFKEVFKNLPKADERTEPKIDAYFEIGINNEYMPEQMDRLNFYTALYTVSTINEIDELKDEMLDRFGELPVNTKRLIAVAVLRYYASFALFERIIIQKKSVSIILPKGEKEEYYQSHFLKLINYISVNHSKTVQFEQRKETMKLVMVNHYDKPEGIVQHLINFTREIMDEVIKK